MPMLALGKTRAIGSLLKSDISQILSLQKDSPYSTFIAIVGPKISAEKVKSTRLAVKTDLYRRQIIQYSYIESGRTYFLMFVKG